MSRQEPYNPLDKRNLGASVADAILKQAPVALPPPQPFDGAGVYAIYYTGSFPQYSSVAKENQDEKFNWPIYVGKAIPEGGRKGGGKGRKKDGNKLDNEDGTEVDSKAGLGLPPDKVGPVMFKRLREHSASIQLATNLNLHEFTCRYLVVDDIWIPLGESLLIERFRPIWNLYIEGFGNHDPGKGRKDQGRSSWDVLHPGRKWADKLTGQSKSVNEILKSLKMGIVDHIKKMTEASGQ